MVTPNGHPLHKDKSYFPIHGIPMTQVRAFIIVGLILAIASIGHAAPARGNIAVSAYISSWGYCTVRNVQDIAFGAINPLNPVNVQATGYIRVRCIGYNSNFTVGVTQVTPSPLLLTSGPHSIPYTLDLPTSGTTPLFIVGNLDIPIKAHIQWADYKLAPAGSYSNTVTVQITP
jgi:spore coat protein U-like protein